MKHHLPKLNQRRLNSHKGDFGRALMIGGSRGMAGAISIASMASLRSGAGLVSAAVPSPILETVAAMHPCLMTIPLESDQEGRIAFASMESIEKRCVNATCVALGPGMGRSEDLNAMVASLFQLIKAPMVVDADALNALSETRHGFPKASGPRILTPHPGEFERLSGVPADNRSDQVAAAIAMAREHQWLVVLKGHETVITDGDTTHINRTGNPKMAVGGSGDCLTGIIAGLICQGLDSLNAARLGTALHGLAGDLAAKRLGCPSVLATDLLEDLPEAFRQLAM